MDFAFVARVLVAAFFVFAGVMHFVRPAFFIAIVPPWLPSPKLLVDISGVCEILGGIGILVPFVRVAAGWGLIALLWAVFPANIHMAVNRVQPEGMKLSDTALWLRLPLQFVLMYIVWWCACRVR